MGCDIHMYIEKRLRPEDAWVLDENHVYEREYPDDPGYLLSATATGRNYYLFGLFAGIRGATKRYKARGLPDDACDTMKEEANGPDWHSHSWLTLDEFKECLIAAEYDLTKNKSTEAFYNYLDYIDQYETRPEDYTTVVNYCEQWMANELAEANLLNRTDVKPEVRIIFWFDN